MALAVVRWGRHTQSKGSLLCPRVNCQGRPVESHELDCDFLLSLGLCPICVPLFTFRVISPRVPESQYWCDRGVWEIRLFHPRP